MKAVILSGLPGAGKTRYAQKLITQCQDYVSHCSADHFHMVDGQYVFKLENARKAHATCLKKYIEACQHEDALVICDNTNVTVAEIAPYYAIAEAHGYEVEVVMFAGTPVGVALQRNVHGVPEETIKKMNDKLTKMIDSGDFPPWWNVRMLLTDVD